jgi:hypothetical protein
MTIPAIRTNGSRRRPKVDSKVDNPLVEGPKVNTEGNNPPVEGVDGVTLCDF